jgi:hypothetical protein
MAASLSLIPGAEIRTGSAQLKLLFKKASTSIDVNATRGGFTPSKAV